MKDRAIRCLGLSSVLLIGVLTIWGGLPLGALTRLELSDILKCWSIPLSIALGMTLCLALLKRTRPSRRFVAAVAAVAAACLLGGFALLYTSVEGFSRVLFVVLSSSAAGVGYGLFSLVWQDILSRLSFNGMTKTLLLSLALGSGEYLALSALLGGNLQAAFPLLVVAATVLSALALRAPDDPGVEGPQPGGRAEGVRGLAKEVGSPLLCVCAIAFAVALTRTITLDGIENSDLVNIVASGCIIVVSLALYAAWCSPRSEHTAFGKLGILGLYRMFFPIIVTALLALSIVGEPLALAVATLAYVLFSFVAVFMMSTSVSIARSRGLWSPHVYGAFAGVTYFVFAGATALGAWVYHPRSFGAATLPVVVLVVFYILAMSYAAIQARKRNGEGRAPGTAERDGGAQASVAATAVVDEVAQRCAIVAEEAGLTKRERDILLVLARGRDVPSIAKQLFISENTVRSHSKSIYRKLKIHSKQELLDLLERVPLDRG
ncbi:helix-turn-helix transcriptional regulator [Eggerthella sinensis]|uniref:helix-turn-helix transcriptional regulator n=1 Tax=Eggerthella sinensis TaxID=242230 RepID=UPI00266C3410|nr:helix-turn-helix transcriptional regulator [Eggerthella sinensis]